MIDSVDDQEAERSRFEAEAARLRGRLITEVDYWDLYSYDASEPAQWDHDDWHHAVMGVQLSTDAGPFTIIWTNTFHPHGVEVFPDPIKEHLLLGPEGPQRIGPDRPGPWESLLSSSVTDVAISWDRLDLGPATRADGTVVSPARTVEVPTALRLDFAAGSVWMVAAIPCGPDLTRAFPLGDEIVIAFSADTLRSLGYQDSDFVTADPPG